MLLMTEGEVFIKFSDIHLTKIAFSKLGHFRLKYLNCIHILISNGWLSDIYILRLLIKVKILNFIRDTRAT